MMTQKILFILFLIVIVVKAHAESFREAQIVFNELTHRANYYPHLKYDASLEINAYSSGVNIIITRGMLNFCKARADLYMVLGHELGHYIHRDYLRHEKKRDFEINADRLGYYYCRQVYSTSQCLYFMKKMYYKFGVDTNDIHPSWPQRIKYVKGQSYV